MLADLRARLRDEPRRRARARHACAGDMRTVRLGERFPLVICPFNTALHLYTREDVERFLARVREHLAPRGELVVDISMPLLEDLARDPARRVLACRASSIRRPGVVEQPRALRLRPRAAGALRVDGVRAERAPRASEAAFMTPLAHRQFFPRSGRRCSTTTAST